MENHIQIKNKKIAYSISGQGKSLVLLHGFLEDSRIWHDFAKSLANDFRVICIDLPGFGKSDVFSDNHSMDFMATCVKAVLDENDIETCVMTGHSMGGYVSLAFAEKYPEMLAGICLFHSHAAPDNEEAKKNRNRTIKIVQDGKKDFIRHFIPTLFAPEQLSNFEAKIAELKLQATETSAEGIVAALRGMRDRGSSIGLLTQIQIPVQFIVGKQDQKIPFDKILAQASLVKYAHILLLGEAGHMGFIEEKKATLAALQSFSKNCFLSAKSQ